MYKRIKTKHAPLILLPSGSTLLNLLLSNTIGGAYPIGKLINIIGDSYAGKTFLFWAMLAEVNRLSKTFSFFYDEPELDFQMDVGYLFGKTLWGRVIKDGDKLTGKKPFNNAVTIEDFLRQVKYVFNNYENAIYGLDSFDTLYSEKEKDNEEPGFKAARRVKVLNEGLRKLMPIMKKKKNTLFIISQVRENLKSMGFGNPKTRSGGRALKHWSTVEFWLSVIEPITKIIRGRREELGALVQAVTSKNRQVGYKGKIRMPILIDYGVGDIDSQVAFLFERKFWSKAKNPFGKMKKTDLVKYIEDNNHEKKLQKHTKTAWDILQEMKKLDRKRRYK